MTASSSVCLACFARRSSPPSPLRDGGGARACAGSGGGTVFACLGADTAGEAAASVAKKSVSTPSASMDCDSHHSTVVNKRMLLLELADSAFQAVMRSVTCSSASHSPS